IVAMPPLPIRLRNRYRSPRTSICPGSLSLYPIVACYPFLGSSSSRSSNGFNTSLPWQGLYGCVGGIACQGESEASHIVRITHIRACNGDGITAQCHVGEDIIACRI